MIGSRVALAVILGAAVGACATSPGPSQQAVAVPSGSARITDVPDSPSPVAATPTPSAPSPTQTAIPSAPSPTPTAVPTATPTPLAVPPPPSGATFKISYPSDTKNKMTVTWKGPRAEGTEIRVYGVTTCIAMPPSPEEAEEGPCLVEHTPLPESVRKLLATTPSSSGKVSWTWPNWENIGSSVAMSPDGTYYEAIVIAAYDNGGHSKFIIVEPGYWCGGCTY